MRKEAIGTGATVEEAVEAAKKALNAPENAEVSTEVISLPQKKILGLFGRAPAKVKAFYDVPEDKKIKQPKPQKQPKAEQTESKTESKKEPKTEPKKEEKKQTAEKPAADVPAAPAEEDAPKTYTGPVTEMGQKALDYIKGILDGMGVTDVDVNMNETDDCIAVDLDCGNGYGFVIGRRGETLDAIQYLTRLVINKGNDDYKRVSINAGNYRQKREDTLRELAKKQAARVRKYGRSVCLDPMNPYERRIIHTTVQEIEGVDSHSVGAEADRKVVITLAEGFKPTHTSNKGGGRGRNDNRHRGGSRHNTSATEQPSRPPRSDAAGSLYGKIEPKKQPETEE